MIRAFHSNEPKNANEKKKFAAVGRKEDVINVGGMILPVIVIEGKFYYDVFTYADNLTHTRRNGRSSVSAWYYSWHRRVDDAGKYGTVIAFPTGVYADIDYLHLVTKALKVVEETPTAFVANVADQYKDTVVSIYRRTFTGPEAGGTKAGFKWSDFFEVKHNTLGTRKTKNTDMSCFNVPVDRKAPEGIKQPEEAEDMPEVIKTNHPVTKEDIVKETEKSPVTKACGSNVADTAASIPLPPQGISNQLSSIPGISDVLSALVGGKKIKLTVTLEVE